MVLFEFYLQAVDDTKKLLFDFFFDQFDVKGLHSLIFVMQPLQTFTIFICGVCNLFSGNLFELLSKFF